MFEEAQSKLSLFGSISSTQHNAHHSSMSLRVPKFLCLDMDQSVHTMILFQCSYCSGSFCCPHKDMTMCYHAVLIRFKVIHCESPDVKAWLTVIPTTPRVRLLPNSMHICFEFVLICFRDESPHQRHCVVPLFQELSLAAGLLRSFFEGWRW